MDVVQWQHFLLNSHWKRMKIDTEKRNQERQKNKQTDNKRKRKSEGVQQERWNFRFRMIFGDDFCVWFVHIWRLQFSIFAPVFIPIWMFHSLMNVPFVCYANADITVCLVDLETIYMTIRGSYTTSNEFSCERTGQMSNTKTWSR